MFNLRRIILINTHLPGVVELSLDGHTNICGTNASGKTTLQRLVPVFYGELPSKVVPKTRSKFGDFYLPKSNSYLVYEYQREEGELCQAVLTHSAKDGVQYRFVDAPYDKSQLLYQATDGKVNAHEPDQWINELKKQSITKSHKISATSEFRAIIQNDVSALRGNTRDGMKLRQLAARYSLVAPRHKVRHIEKLVSAVHAKEGKMDTLKTMLAAIFEEDGLVQPTTRVKNTKAREWIKQIRQSMRLSSLEQAHQEIEQVALSLNTVEGQLVLLSPLLVQDLADAKIEKADIEALESQLRQQLSQVKNQFNDQETSLNSERSAAIAELNTAVQQLDKIQSTYDDYQASDILQLAIDFDAMPVWTEELIQQQSHYRLLLEQVGDLENTLNHQKLSLNESLQRLSNKNRKLSHGIEDEREQTRQAQADKKDQLNEQYLARKDKLQQAFSQQIDVFKHQQIERQAQIDNMGPTAQEQEELSIADKRLELAQDNWRSASDGLTRVSKEQRQAKVLQEQAQTELEQARSQVNQITNHLRQLEQQMSPEQGSLRHYLRAHVDGWENSIGKVINQDLLERGDLQPNLTDAAGGDLFGIKLNLSAIESPSYAQDEAALSIEKEQLTNRLSVAKQTQEQKEKGLTQAHQQLKTLSDQVQKATQSLDDLNNELTYAKESKIRLIQSTKTSLLSRKEHASSDLKQAIAQIEKLSKEQAQSLDTLKSDHQQQLLEFKADWQQEIDLFNQRLAELEQQIEHKRDTNRVQIKQLQQAFDAELAKKDIDPNTLADLKHRINELETQIEQVRARADELSHYKNFLEVTWQKSRPQYLEKETALKAQLQSLDTQLNQLKTQFKSQHKALEEQRADYKAKQDAIAKTLAQLTPLLTKLEQLALNTELGEGMAEIAGDLAERIARANQGLELRSKTLQSLKEKLNHFESQLVIDAQKQFLDLLNSELSRLDEQGDLRERVPVFNDLLRILADQQRQILEQGETIGGDLHKFFTVFSDINRRISGQSKRLTSAVADDLVLDGINRSEVKIISTVDELNFWAPLKRFASLYEQWRDSGKELPSDQYIDALSAVVDLLRSDSSYSIESLLRLELHLNEGGNDLVIRNDRQLLESSSHGMAYLILCKFLLAFTRLLRGEAQISVNWPIDEIGTLAYHNVEKLFEACQDNNICIVGAFPNPESDVLTLFKNRYLIDKQYKRLQRIEPKVNRLEQKLAQTLHQSGANA